MSVLLVHELGITGGYNNGLVRQCFTVGETRMDITAVRFHLYKHLAPAGSVYVQLQDIGGAKIKDSEVITLASISAANYFHGIVRFLLPASLARRTTYCLELKGVGYTYGAGAHIAGVQERDSIGLEVWGWRSSEDMKGVA